jgi:hypothetical protein
MAFDPAAAVQTTHRQAQHEAILDQPYDLNHGARHLACPRYIRTS